MKRPTMPMLPRTQRGAAILTAMLTVVLVASLAAATLWQQWRAVEVETAERSRTQSAWVLTGALDWARLILREDARKGGSDHLAEPWAMPLEQARLSTFLAADRSDALAADQAQEAFLSGQMIDLQSRLNVFNLLQDGKLHEPSRVAFARLFELLNLAPGELDMMVHQLRLAAEASAATAPVAVVGHSSAAPLWPQNVDQLSWVGLSPRSMAVLRPYITVLPVRTPVNLNTASAEVIYACVEDLEFADANRLVSARNLTPLSSLAEAGKLAGNSVAKFNDAQHSVASNYFEVRGLLRVEQTVVQEQSVVQRVGLDVKTLSRQRTAAASAPLQ